MRRVTAQRLEGTTVAVVGAGTSTLADALLEGGAHVVAVDVSAVALDRLATRTGRHERLRTVVGDVCTVDVGTVDVWHDRAVLHFLTEPADQEAYARNMARTVRPGGHAVVATFAPDGPERCSGLPVQRHDARSLARLFEPAFTLVDHQPHRHVTPWGAEQPFTYAVFRRSDPQLFR